MGRRQRQNVYAGLWVVAVAFGWIEASVVVYLRALHAPEALAFSDHFAGLPVDLASLPDRFVAIEMAREAATILLLAATASLAGRCRTDRMGAFLLAFGIWDLTYYGVLRVLLGWPDSLGVWDVLFLIPRPWVAPVWAPMTLALLFVAVGSYLFWTSDRERRYRGPDISVLVGSAVVIVGAFLVESEAAIGHRVPVRFPLWLFSAGVVMGVAWFVRVEQRTAAFVETRERWVGVRVRTILPMSVADDRPGPILPGDGQPSDRDLVDRSLGFFHERRQRRSMIGRGARNANTGWEHDS